MKILCSVFFSCLLKQNVWFMAEYQFITAIVGTCGDSDASTIFTIHSRAIPDAHFCSTLPICHTYSGKRRRRTWKYGNNVFTRITWMWWMEIFSVDRYIVCFYRFFPNSSNLCNFYIFCFTRNIHIILCTYVFAFAPCHQCTMHNCTCCIYICI